MQYVRAGVNNLGFINYSRQFNKAAKYESAQVINLYGIRDFPDHSAYFKETVPKCNKTICNDG